jgi:hypothetical protein
VSGRGRTARLVSIGLVALAAAGPVGAQQLPADSTRTVHVPRLVGASIVTTAASIPGGLLLGAWLGSMSCSPTRSCGYRVLDDAALGGVLLPAIMLPVAVHLANGRSGSFLATAGASAVATAAAALLLGGLDGLGSRSGNSVLVAPVAAAVASVVVEIATTDRAPRDVAPNP